MQFNKWNQRAVLEKKKSKGLLSSVLKKKDSKVLFSQMSENIQVELTGNEIGVPINIKHEGHIGFDNKEGGFTVITNFLLIVADS